MKKFMLFVSLVIMASMILASCGPKETVVPTEAPTTETPVETEVPTVPASTRRGGWADEVVVSVVSSDQAVTQIKADALDVYAAGLSSADLPAIKEAGLAYTTQNGLYYDMIYNPAVCEDATILNPFSSRKIREATNYLFDRNYMNQEIYNGGSLVKFFAITTEMPDYADLADTVARLENKYAYNLETGKEIIATEMTAMGATLNAEGKWEYSGKPVTLILLIRPDSDGTRKPIGDYVATQLEAVGFTVDSQYKKSSEASPIWIGSEPKTCQWNAYTSAWSSTQISRDEKDMFQQMYLPSSVQGMSVFMANVPDPEYQKLGDDLANGNFKSLEERHTMMARALELSMEDSLQVWLIDGKGYCPHKTDLVVTGDLAAGIEGAQIWPMSIRWEGQEGGTIRYATNSLFDEAWNPVQGSNWAWDQGVMRALDSRDFMADPFTGLYWPLRVEKTDVVVETGLVVGKTLDWVNLGFQDKIDVPAEAWIDWDATNQVFVTVGEKHPEGLTAKGKIVYYYPADLFTTVKWHDGSYLSLGDMVLSMIVNMDRAKPESAVYDESWQAFEEANLTTFKGWRIVSEDPFVFELYTDQIFPDAEWIAAYGNTAWPHYQYGEGAWPTVTLALMAEQDGDLAFSADKATAKTTETKTVEQTSFVGGPSLDIMAAELDKAINEVYIPYANTLGKFITRDEAIARYAAVKDFYAANKNFWIGTGPYFLAQADLNAKIVTLRQWADYPDLSSRWSSFSEPKIAAVTLDGPGQVKIGDEAVFDVMITFKDAPYPAAEVKQVKFMVYNAKGEVVTVADAAVVEDGHFQATLTKDMTSALEAGSNKLQVAVIVLPVAVPTFASIDFVTAP